MATVLREAWHRFAPLTSLEKAACLVFGAAMHLVVLGQLMFAGWLLLVVLQVQP